MISLSSSREEVKILHTREENILFWLHYVLDARLRNEKGSTKINFDGGSEIMTGKLLFTGDPLRYWLETNPWSFHHNSYYRNRKKPC